MLGVTGSGKTFTVANVIEKNPETLHLFLVIIKHLQLSCMVSLNNSSQITLSNILYRITIIINPKHILPVTDTYIEKDLSINQEIEKLRLSATSSLLSGRKDVIVVSSVSCIYGIGNPDDFHSNTITIKQGDQLSRNKFLRTLVESLYSQKRD
ncbi:MAG: hypothetical protein MZV63_40690 [Marinilabiliales bacterium]|nr:hypothetical protein [Marinilabiliales bacterium]